MKQIIELEVALDHENDLDGKREILWLEILIFRKMRNPRN